MIEFISNGLREPGETMETVPKEVLDKRAIDQSIVQHALWSLVNDGMLMLSDAFVVVIDNRRSGEPRPRAADLVTSDPATQTVRDKRLHGTAKRVDDRRSEAQRDRDRLLYAPAFRRLAGVTQVVGLGEVQLFHNRLTHSLKVAQVARRIAERIRLEDDYAEAITVAGGVDPDCVEVAALAHDLGHPPFGHVAELRLQEVLRRECPCLDSFEGNAQSFRIVTKLSVRGDVGRGLNLTSASLRACTKYPWLWSRDDTAKANKKWGAYRSEEAELNFAMGGEHPKASVEAQVMDWADDIAYAVHDIEDFFRTGLIPLDRITNERDVGRDFARVAAERLAEDAHADRTAARAREFWDGLPGEPLGGFAQSGLIPLEPFSGSFRDQSLLQAFASGLTTRYINAVRLDALGLVDVDERFRYEVEMLKQLTRYFVIDDPALAAAQEGQCRVIEELFMTLWKRATGAKSLSDARLPTLLQGFLLVAYRDPPDAYGSGAELAARAVVDYIASLTEQQAVSLHQRLTGASSASALDAWLRG